MYRFPEVMHPNDDTAPIHSQECVVLRERWRWFLKVLLEVA